MSPISDIFPQPEFEQQETISSQPSPRTKKKGVLIFILVFVLIAVSFLAYFKYFPRCEIKLVLKKYPQNFEQEITAGLNQPLPVQYFSQEGELKLSFKSTGRKQVEKKAQGKILIYNAYSSTPQLLVKGTRFQTKDGLIYRLKKRIVVPGAVIEEGKIVPSVIETDVDADKPGEKYNIGPQEKFTIPGFKGSKKYQAFYAASSQPMKGGFIGEVSTPTKEDIEKAREKSEEKLLANLKAKVFSVFPKDLKYFNESQNFEILEEKTKEDDKGGFYVELKGKYELLSFKESKLKEIILEKTAFSERKDIFLADSKINYKDIKSDFQKRELSFIAWGKLIFKKKIDKNLFLEQVKGKNKNTAENIISSLPGLDYAKVKIQPFFAKKLPSDLRKIKIEIQ